MLLFCNGLFQESKYLGGDMEHTHLVKGLDYALLQKVRIHNILEKILYLLSILSLFRKMPNVTKKTENG